MDKEDLLRLAKEFEKQARNNIRDGTKVDWLLHQAKICRRKAEGKPEPRVNSHHMQFHWL